MNDDTLETASLQQLLEKLRTIDPTKEHIYYELTAGNTLPDDAFWPTPPAMWGKPAKDLPAQHSDGFRQALGNIVLNAQSSLDILSLGYALPSGAFLSTLTACLDWIYDRPLTVRIALGRPGLMLNLDTLQLLKDITAPLLKRPSPTMKVYVAQVCTKDIPFKKAWNHAKIYAADGAVAMVGGHNLWADSYLHEDPIFDLSMKVVGPAAASAQKFANQMWEFIRANNVHRWDWHTFSNSFDAATGIYDQKAAPALVLQPPAGTGQVTMLGVASPGWGLTSHFDDKNASEIAMLYWFDCAQRSIYVSQQDLITWGNLPTVNEAVFASLARFLVERRGRIGVVLSTPGAKSLEGFPYSANYTLEHLLWQFRFAVEKLSNAPRGRDLEDLLQRQILPATLRFNHTDEAWPKTGRKLGNHAKFWMVDERVFYVGSHNMYPSVSPIEHLEASLQEYGFIVDHAASAARLLKQYWQPLTEYSMDTSIGGTYWGVPSERFSVWKRAIEVPAAKRMGEITYDPFDSRRVFHFSLSGAGEVIARSLNAESGDWRVVDVTAPPSPATTVGCALPGDHASAFVGAKDGRLFQLAEDKAAGKWSWLDKGLLRGERITGIGPVVEKREEGFPFVFFAMTESGKLFDYGYYPADNKWLEHLHDQFPGGRVASLGPILHTRSTHPKQPTKFFLLGADGNLYERFWQEEPENSQDPEWEWLSHGRPAGQVVAALGPVLFDPGINDAIKIFALTASGDLWERHWDRRARKWEWESHNSAGVPIRAFGPVYLSGDRDRPAKLFAVGETGRLHEHYWSMASSTWLWEDHGQPIPGMKVVAVGPRMLDQRYTLYSPKVFVMTDQGWFFERRWHAEGATWSWIRHVAV